MHETTRFLRLTQLRGAQLVVGLLLYQKRHSGKPAEQLADLVQDEILPAVPVDPYSNRPFQYRLSKGELIRWRPITAEAGGTDWWEEPAAVGMGMGAPDGGVAAAGMPEPGPQALPEKGLPTGTHRIVRARWGVVWSTGPDGVDNGGQRQIADLERAGYFWNRTNGEDIIFLAPPVK
jgi:hypothetical protein